jgi:hypothetical protein
MTVFSDIALCSLVEVDGLSSGANCLVTFMMEADSTPETSVNFYQTTQRNTPKDRHLYSRALRT